MNLILSIIIPVYNTEKWIARCLDSCLNQDIPHEEYEIIVVNDGSPDDSMSIVNEYAAKHTNIRVIHQQNRGLSAARNTGLKYATGTYVWFVDSDDFIESTCLGDLLKQAEKDSLDVLCFKPYLLFEDGRKDIFEIPFQAEKQVYDGSDFICKVDMPPAAWCALYQRSFLLEKALQFKEGIYHEDQEFTPRAYYLASRIEFINTCAYYYFQRTGSIMKSSNPKKAHDLLVVADSLYNFAQQRMVCESSGYRVMTNKISFAFSQSLRNCQEITSETIKEYESKPYYPLAINDSLSSKERIKYRLINRSVRLYLLVYKLFKL